MAEQSTLWKFRNGCPVIRWDGPYRFRCGMGAGCGICSIHGPFEGDEPDEQEAADDA